MEPSELLPCPFCGGQAMPALIQAGGIEWAQVKCVEQDCGAVGPTPATEAQAITAWNTRSSMERLALAENMARALDEGLSAAIVAPAGLRIQILANAIMSALSAWKAQ